MNITKDNATFRYRDEQTKHWKQRTRDYGFLHGNANLPLLPTQHALHWHQPTEIIIPARTQ